MTFLVKGFFVAGMAPSNKKKGFLVIKFFLKLKNKQYKIA